MRRWLLGTVFALAALLAVDVLVGMVGGPSPLALGPITLPLRRMQLEVSLAAALAAVGLLTAGAGRRPRLYPWVIGLLTLAAGHANTRSFGSADTTATASIPFVVVRQGTLAFDGATWLPRDATAYYLTPSQGRTVGMYPVATGVLATPFYLPAALGHFDPAVDPVSDLEKLAAGSLTALATALLFVAIRRQVGERVATLTIAAWVLGTAVNPVLAQALWQHTGGVFALCGALWAWSLPPERAWRVAAVGLFAGLAGACRPLDLLLGGAVVLMLAKERWRSVAGASAAAAVPLGLVALYNQWAFGAPLSTGYGTIAREGFGGDWLEGFVGLLVSPARGLFVLSPVLLLAVIPLAKRAPLLALASFASVGIYARWAWWHGGYAPGQRYLSDLLPFLGYGLAFGIRDILVAARRWRRALLIGAAAWSVTVHALLTYVVPPAPTKALIWELVEGPFSPRAFPPAAYVVGWTQRSPP